jgi:DNA-binding transcriptional LysR family regulator
MTLRIGFVLGATPDKWARAWRDQQDEPLELVPIDQADQDTALQDYDACIVRLPVDTVERHVVRLYEELPVAVMGIEHLLTLEAELTTSDLDEEQLVLPHPSGWTPSIEQLSWPEMSVKDAIETVAAGTGVAIVPMSLARLFHRKDATYRVVTDLEPTQIALVWDKADDGDRIQNFVGVVKGRTARTSR